MKEVEEDPIITSGTKLLALTGFNSLPTSSVEHLLVRNRI